MRRGFCALGSGDLTTEPVSARMAHMDERRTLEIELKLDPYPYLNFWTDKEMVTVAWQPDGSGGMEWAVWWCLHKERHLDRATMRRLKFETEERLVQYLQHKGVIDE